MDIDEQAVQRAVEEDRSVRLTSAEMSEVLRRLECEGYEDDDIAAMVGISKRTVNRWRSGEPINGRSGLASGVAIEVRKQTTDELIESGLQSPSKRVQSAARAAVKAIAALQSTVDEDRASRKAKSDIARLERELAEAKSRLIVDPSRRTKSKGSLDYTYAEVWDFAETIGISRKRGRPTNFIIKKFLEHREQSS